MPGDPLKVKGENIVTVTFLSIRWVSWHEHDPAHTNHTLTHTHTNNNSSDNKDNIL